MGIVNKLFGNKDRRNPKHNVHQEREKITSFDERERDKRNPKSHVNEVSKNIENTQRSTLRTTIPFGSHHKNGYVDVNLIPRPTAIVRLRDNKVKRNKLKNFFNKLRFRKRKRVKEAKKNERTKRDEYSRVQRFNLLKKLRDMFRVKQAGKVETKENEEIHDYEMMTSHIDTFKPVKYDKVPPLDELKGQIPNITEDHSPSVVQSDKINSAEVSKAGTKPASFDLSFDVPLIPEVYETTSVAAVNTTKLHNDLTSKYS